jgi:deoxyadenosine/deoxycytidine kinase
MDKFLYSENYKYTSTLHKYFLIKHLKNIEKNGNIKNTKLLGVNQLTPHDDAVDYVKYNTEENYKILFNL